MAQGFEVAHASADLAELEIIRPGCFVIFRILFLELHGAHGGQRVVDVIERIEEDVQLVIPPAAAGHKFIVFIRPPGHIFPFQFVPFAGPFFRCKFRMCVANMLEFVNGNAEGNKGDGLLQMGEAEFISLITEEIFRPGVAKLLHGHGMDLGDIRGFRIIIGYRLIAHCHVTGKGVPKFVCQYLNIPNSPVETGENKRSQEVRKIGHVACGGLARFVFQIHQTVIDHEVDEFAGFRTELMVHLLRLWYQHLVIPDGLGVAIRENAFFVINHHVGDAETFCLSFV